MKKKRTKAIDIPTEREPFRIFQFAKIEGIRNKRPYKKTHFVSPIWGTRVKDVVAIPYSVKNSGDTTKRFDAFRTKAKLTEKEAIEKYGNKYYEFTNIITEKTRRDFFGDDGFEDYEEPERKTEEKPGFIMPILKRKGAQKDESRVTSEPKAKPVAHIPPVTNEPLAEKPLEKPAESHFERPEEEPQPGTYQREDNRPRPIIRAAFTKAEPRFSDEIGPIGPSDYQLPNVRMFAKKERDLNEKPDWLLEQIAAIDRTLDQFGVEGHVSSSKKGPTVTRHEIALDPGVNVRRVVNIRDNLMMNLSSKALRIEAPIPGKPYVGLEVPNAEPEIVAFGNVADTEAFLKDRAHPLKVALGIDIDGESIYLDIAAMPHGLIAGATNSGKSVCINTVLASLLLKNTPEDLRLMLIDPKMVELTPYNDLPHLITPVITDARVAASALAWVVSEMEKRYQAFAASRTRDINAFNEQIRRGLIEEKRMPFIVIIIDELADLMMVAPHDVEDAIQRITQKARAAGIHLIVATQRPTTDVVKGTIKSNIPVRIAFHVASYVDSTTILDGSGAENLLGKGDMLLKKNERPLRLQGAYISDQEIDRLTEHIRNQKETDYLFGHEDLERRTSFDVDDIDELFEDVAYFVVNNGSASINSIQKEFEVGFNRAQKLVEMLEHYGIVAGSSGTKAREVLRNIVELNELFNREDEI
ncbi:MAG: DNA translocase FtsK [Acholeplasmataceae bacterium]